MSRRVLLTGATGFVGRQVLRALAQAGVTVDVVIREGTRARLAGLPATGRVITTPDLFAQDAGWWVGACEDVDTVVHCAWYAEPGKYLQSPRNLDCLRGTLNLADGAARAGVHRFVGVGSCFEYELGATPRTVQTPLRPTTPYAGAKAAAALALGQWLPTQGIAFAWCRLFYLYGEGEDARRLVPYVRAQLAAGAPAELTNGTQVRDFLDVVEAGRQIAAIALGNRQGAFNICSGEPVTVRELAERIAAEYGRQDLLRFGARPDNAVDPPYVVGVPELGIGTLAPAGAQPA